MGFPLRLSVTLLCLLGGVLPVRAAPDKPLERGTAILDPPALRELDRGRFGLGRILQPARSADMPLDNAQLFALPSMARASAFPRSCWACIRGWAVRSG